MGCERKTQCTARRLRYEKDVSQYTRSNCGNVVFGTDEAACKLLVVDVASLAIKTIPS